MQKDRIHEVHFIKDSSSGLYTFDAEEEFVFPAYISYVPFGFSNCELHQYPFRNS